MFIFNKKELKDKEFDKEFKEKVSNRKQGRLLKNSVKLTIALLLTQTVYAENTSEVVSFHDQSPDSNTLLNAFLKKDNSGYQQVRELAQNTSTKQPLMRGIGIKKKNPLPSEHRKETINNISSSQLCMAGSQSVAVSINFKSNSKNINGSDSDLIKNIAQAMNSPELANCFFTVEGHTDAKGNDYYNLWLSQERAQEVKNQLDGYNVSENRLIVVGKGESQLFNNKKPFASENRRVEFKVINYSN